MMKNEIFIRKTIISSLLLTFSVMSAQAQSSSGGITLLATPGARSAALGEAFTGVSNDISALGYNPSSLSSLSSHQALLMFEKGLAEDSFGQLMIGGPVKSGGFGISFGYYDGGDLQVTENNAVIRTVRAQSDRVAALGYAHSFGSLSLGVSGKYLYSELAELETAETFAADMGAAWDVHQRLRFGMAAQNFGGGIRYVQESDPLPRLLRAGFALGILPGQLKMTLVADAFYLMNEQELQPAAGLETALGPVVLRAGYKSGSDVEDFSFGVGFLLGKTSLDYSFGLADQLSATHRVNLAMKFGGPQLRNDFVRRRPVHETGTVVAGDKALEEQKQTAMEDMGRKESVQFAKPSGPHALGDLDNANQRRTYSDNRRRIYIVKEGDTLGSIAHRMYGDRRLWTKIYTANKHLIGDARSIEIGQKIILP